MKRIVGVLGGRDPASGRSRGGGGPYLGIIDQAVSLDAWASSDVEGAALTYSWNFGDGTTLVTTNATPAHTYAAAGMYTITLTVSDGALDSSPVTSSATVSDPLGSGHG